MATPGQRLMAGICSVSVGCRFCQPGRACGAPAYNLGLGGYSMGGELTRGFRAFLIASGLLYALVVVVGWLVGGA